MGHPNPPSCEAAVQILERIYSWRCAGTLEDEKERAFRVLFGRITSWPEIKRKFIIDWWMPRGRPRH
jgi:hypothetical protein